MLKVLVPVDGSPQSDRAVAQVLEVTRSGAIIDLHLLNVQIPIDGHASSFISREALDTYHREEGLAALVNARRLLDEAGVPHHDKVVVGHVAETIVRYATEQGFHRIVMGTHGRGGFLDVLLGSVAHDVVKHSTVPVTLVR